MTREGQFVGGELMDTLKSHYRLWLGLDELWMVTDVALETAEKRVTIALEFVGNDVSCPECSVPVSRSISTSQTWQPYG